ncbi:Exodeoxyribonuclease V alpha chain [Chitinispirillum alkaliphilum]|nr:Exodeoxyribonuclease V alpha chain [Chitinispirillum alkaliphilum]
MNTTSFKADQATNHHRLDNEIPLRLYEVVEKYLLCTGQIGAFQIRQARILSRSVKDKNLIADMRVILLLNLVSLNRGAPRATRDYLLAPFLKENLERSISLYSEENPDAELHWCSVAGDPDTLTYLDYLISTVYRDPSLYSPLAGEYPNDDKNTVILQHTTPLLIVDRERKLMGFSRYYCAAISLQDSLEKRLSLTLEKMPDQARAAEIMNTVFDTRSILPTGQMFHYRQAAAAALALRTPFLIVSGAPGTGKTRVVIQILRVLLYAYEDIMPDRVVLCAPTGRAKARLGESIRDDIRRIAECNSGTRDAGLRNLQCKTLHSLLGIYGDGKQRYNRHNPLPYQVIIVDEASMVDLHLFSSLMEAASDDCHIILAGDMHQLPSVHAGAVLGDLTSVFSKSPSHPTLTKECLGWVEKITGDCILEGDDKASRESLVMNNDTAGPLSDHTIILNHSYRSNSSIVELSRLINGGDYHGTRDFLLSSEHGEVSLMTCKKNEYIQEWVENWYCDWIKGLQNLRTLPLSFFSGNENSRDSQHHSLIKNTTGVLEASRILTLANHGPTGRKAINHLAENILVKKLGKKTGRFFHGQQIMLSHNIHDLSLFNGDMGIVVEAPNGVLYALFCRAESYSVFPLSRLTGIEPAFAMTVHKSQGSEFKDVLLVLPESETPLLTRQVIYTGITRAKNRIVVHGTEEMLRLAIERREDRPGGVEI